MMIFGRFGRETRRLSWEQDSKFMMQGQQQRCACKRSDSGLKTLNFCSNAQSLDTTGHCLSTFSKKTALRFKFNSIQGACERPCQLMRSAALAAVLAPLVQTSNVKKEGTL
jgi:hypothetical protein